MAVRKKLKLNGFDVTLHAGNGQRHSRILHRGEESKLTDSAQSIQSLDLEEPEHDVDYVVHSSARSSTSWDELPSFHSIKQTSSTEAWGKIRGTLKRVLVEGNAMPYNQNCVICRATLASFCCIDCGPAAYFCNECLASLHNTACVLHTPEEWKVRN